MPLLWLLTAFFLNAASAESLPPMPGQGSPFVVGIANLTSAEAVVSVGPATIFSQASQMNSLLSTLNIHLGVPVGTNAVFGSERYWNDSEKALYFFPSGLRLGFSATSSTNYSPVGPGSEYRSANYGTSGVTLYYDGVGSYTYDVFDPISGRITQTTQNGVSTTFGYEQVTYGTQSSTHLKTVEDASGNIITLTYDSNGNLSTMSTPDGNVETFNYNQGYFTGITGPGGPRNLVAWTNGVPVSVTQYPTNITTTISYNSSGRIAKWVDTYGTSGTPVDSATNVSYPSANSVQISTSLGSATYTFGLFGNQWKLTNYSDTEKETRTYTWDPTTALLTAYSKVIGPANGQSGESYSESYQYDSNGHPVVQVQGGVVTNTVFDPATGIPTSITNANEKFTTTRTLNSMGQIVSEQIGPQITITRTFNGPFLASQSTNGIQESWVTDSTTGVVESYTSEGVTKKGSYGNVLGWNNVLTSVQTPYGTESLSAIRNGITTGSLKSKKITAAASGSSGVDVTTTFSSADNNPPIGETSSYSPNGFLESRIETPSGESESIAISATASSGGTRPIR